MTEVWKDIPTFKKGYYQVSNFGRVRSLERYVKDSSGRVQHKPELYMKMFPNRTGYIVVSLCGGYKDNGSRRSYNYQVHRLVMMAFNPNPDPNTFTEIDHRDGDKSNNRLDNLKWCTHEENMKNPLTGIAVRRGRGTKVRCVETGIVYDSINQADILTGEKVMYYFSKGRKTPNGFTYEEVQKC